MHLVAIDYSDEIGQSAIQFAFVVVLGGIAGAMWASTKRRREIDLASLDHFHQCYGRWFSTWKDWEDALDAEKRGTAISKELRECLCRRATEVEGQFEALLLKIATERRLTSDQSRRLGRFREGYQRLRETIEKESDMGFWVTGSPEAVGQYVTFKALSVEFAALLGHSFTWRRPSSWLRPSLKDSQRAFLAVTSWRVAGNDKSKWWIDDARVGVIERNENVLRDLRL
jgi:hypothetical protein